MGKAQIPVILSHEYTHAVISMMTNNNCPVWLHEGIAVYEQSKYDTLNLSYLETFINNGGIVSLEELEKGFTEHENREILGVSYAGSYMAVSFILDKWGWPGLRGLLARVKEGKHFANAIDEEFYLSTEAFEDMCNKYIKREFSEK